MPLDGSATSTIIGGYAELSPTTDSGMVAVGYSRSEVQALAATWERRRHWQVPVGSRFQPRSAYAGVTTAGSRSYVGIGMKLGAFNFNTNVFTDGGSVSAPLHFDKMFLVITNSFAGVANTITIAILDERSISTAAADIVLPATTQFATAYEALFVTSNGNGGIGVRDVTSIIDTAAPAAGACEVWGYVTLLETMGIANGLEQVTYTDLVGTPISTSIFPTFISIFTHAAAVTAQQRQARVLGLITS